MRYLAGEANMLAGSLALGTGSKVAAVGDTRLTYEFDRANIYLVSPDYLTNKIVFKGTLREGTVGKISEVGLYSGEPTTLTSRTLATFERSLESWTTPNFVAGNQRIGTEALRFSPNASGTISNVLGGVGFDLSGYSNTDVISLAFHSLNTNTSSVKVRLRNLDTTAYYEYTISTVTAGYNVATFAKSSMTRVGAADFSAIDSIELSVSAKAAGAAQVDVDGIRIESEVPSINNVLISRSVLATPIDKPDLQEMDIEYTLEVAF